MVSNEQMSLYPEFEDQSFGGRNGFVPLDWQQECHDHYLNSVQVNKDWQHAYCLFAGTGSGKTKASGLLVSSLLNTRSAKQVVVVSPSVNTMEKTREVYLHSFGIDLAVFDKRKHGNGKGVHMAQQGYVTTYQSLINQVSDHRSLARRFPTVVVFDEIHHLGDNSEWGGAAVEAFQFAKFVISLTGTPYRSDDRPIPFVTYGEPDENKLRRLRADFEYTLGRAIAEDVCRKPIFTFYDGPQQIRYGTITETLNFGDAMSATKARHILGTVVRYGSEHRKTMLRKALAECMRENRKVIIFLGGDTCGENTPTEDARYYLPSELHELGYGPDTYEVIVSDDEEAHDKINAFGASPKRILVSINMVSEGTDIPEISAAIFLSSVTAKLTSMQRIGRALRMMRDDIHRSARIFMFDDPDLRSLSVEIEKEILIEVSLLEKKRRAASEDGTKSERYSKVEGVSVGVCREKYYRFNGRSFPADLVDGTRSKLKSENLPEGLFYALCTMIMRDQHEECDVEFSNS